MRRQRERRFERAWAIVLVVAAVTLTAASASAGGPDWKGPVYRITEGELTDEIVAGSKATITRHPSKVDFTFKTRDLDRRHAYTIWLITWNFPELCQDADAERGFRCGAGDYFNVAAGFSVIYGTGDVVAGKSHRFSGEREAFDPDGAFGPGLIDPEGAEIHLVLRDHGPCQPGLCEEQVSTHDGGCSNPMFAGLAGEPGDYECTQTQATGH